MRPEVERMHSVDVEVSLPKEILFCNTHKKTASSFQEEAVLLINQQMLTWFLRITNGLVRLQPLRAAMFFCRIAAAL